MQQQTTTMVKAKKKQQTNNNKKSSAKTKRSGGRGSTKKKDQQEQQEQELENILAQANAQDDPLKTLPPSFLNVPLSSSSSHSSDNEHEHQDVKDDNVAIIRHIPSPLPPNILKQCLELFEMNMGEMYKQSHWGLDMDEKMKEFQHADARFLVVLKSDSNSKNNNNNNNNNSNSSIDTITEQSTNNTATVIGFAHFRYDQDDDDTHDLKQLPIPVSYLYELQVHPSYQKLGLGKKLMTCVELIAVESRMKKVMLTVFHSNVAAMGFYEKKMRYVVDDCSPSNFEGEENENCDYEILSKVLIGAGAGALED